MHNPIDTQLLQLLGQLLDTLTAQAPLIFTPAIRQTFKAEFGI